ncbi:MAG: glycosyltransferase family 2 protein [Eudoraea sp.]|nr:glycosyltransferase family 2 protein [Eudoraea sp.]
MKENELPKISIIIPVLNEEEALDKLLPYLQAHAANFKDLEVIVSDGGSSDSTITIARKYGVCCISSERGRASQMNAGAKKANSSVLYFLHADSLPPKNFDQAITSAINAGIPAGCFRLKFNVPSKFLAFFAWFTRFNLPLCRGGDQSLFISKSLFTSTGGFNEKYRIYEDNEFIGRIYRSAKFRVLPQEVITSARKYESNGALRLQYHFTMVHLKKFAGASPESLYAYYNKHIR